MDLNHYLHLMATRAASDLFVGAPPTMKCEGETAFGLRNVIDNLNVAELASDG